MQAHHAAGIVLACLLAASCGGVTEPSKNTTETFSDTLPPGGFKSKQVQVNNGGEFSVKLTALAPTPTAIVGTAWAFGANCEQVQQQNAFSTLNQQVLFGAIVQKGTYCVAIFDNGTLTTAQTFTLTISHP